MECGEACKGVEDVTMLTCELEAAEALAGLARSSSLSGEFERRACTEAVVIAPQTSQYQASGGHQLSRETSTTVVTTPNQSCNTSNQSKVSSTLRHNSTEADKEEKVLRRVLANRESARQTIRRRKAMHLELSGKAASLLKENTYLKQERELAVKKYNYLKDKNEFLKAQMGKRNRDEAGHIHDRRETSCTEISSSAAATTPICLHNRPSLVPFFWPTNSQCISDTDLTNASQFCVPIWDESCSSLGQECSTAITKPRPPFFILPVPCLLPSLSPNGKLEFHGETKDQQHEPPLIHQGLMCLSLSTLAHEGTGVGVYNSERVTPTSNDRGAGLHFPPDSKKQRFMDMNRGRFSSSRKPGKNDIATTEARRKRRELMKLKNSHSPDMHSR